MATARTPVSEDKRSTQPTKSASEQPVRSSTTRRSCSGTSASAVSSGWLQPGLVGATQRQAAYANQRHQVRVVHIQPLRSALAVNVARHDCLRIHPRVRRQRVLRSAVAARAPRATKRRSPAIRWGSRNCALRRARNRCNALAGEPSIVCASLSGAGPPMEGVAPDEAHV